MTRILCIEDDADTCELITLAFQQCGNYEVVSCSAPEEGLRLVAKQQQGGFAAIILDYRSEGKTGVETCSLIRNFNQFIPIVFFTGEAREAEKAKALAAGASDYLIKPLDFKKLTKTVIELINTTVK